MLINIKITFKSIF